MRPPAGEQRLYKASSASYQKLRRYSPFVLLALLSAVSAPASTIGINPPAQSITQSRIEKLPEGQRAQWLRYLERSIAQRRLDQATFAAELKRSGLTHPIEPPHSNSARSIPLDEDPAWYATPEARHIADVIVSFQTPAGGWGKNMDMSKQVRRPGESYVTNNLSRFLSPGDYDTPADPNWNYVGTIDNDATTTELRYLAKVITAAEGAPSAPYRKSFLKGLDYLFAAQFPNGGWPQVWPLEGGYHDAITLNDSAMIEVLEVLYGASSGSGDYSFVPPSVRARATASFERGLGCILALQIVVHRQRTAWAQQYDALTLAPVSARNYEMPANSGGESADVLMFLMDDVPHPTALEAEAVRAAAAWFKKVAIYGEQWERTPNGRELVAKADAGPIWARYYQIGTNKPIFGDRDKTIHDNVADLSRERRNGYAWYSSKPQRALDRFAEWNAGLASKQSRL